MILIEIPQFRCAAFGMENALFHFDEEEISRLMIEIPQFRCAAFGMENAALPFRRRRNLKIND